MTKEIIGIYKITNKINGKIYIGQSVNIINRKKTHYRKYHKGCPHLYNAMDKYGFDNFEFEVIEECDIEDLDRLEQKYIKELNTFSPNGYNLDTGGSSNKQLSEETKQKISKHNIGEKNKMYGKTHSEEVKVILKEVNQGRRASKETKELLRTIRQKNKTNGSKKVKDKNGRVWGSISDCYYELGISKHLTNMLNGKRPKTKIVKDLGLVYADDSDVVTQIIESKNYDKKINKAFKPLIDKYGNIFKNIKECADYYNIPRLSRFLKNTEKITKDVLVLGIRYMDGSEIIKHSEYLKRHTNKGNPKQLIDNNGNIYNSIKECSEKLDIPHLDLYLSGKREMPNKYKKFGIRLL